MNLQNAIGNAIRAPHRYRVVRDLGSRIQHARHIETRDSLTYDQQTIDSSGAFLVGQLERLDPKLHQPLVSYKWSRDINIRTDVTMGDEDASFTNSMYGSAPGVAGSNKAWIGKESTALVGVSLDIGKTKQPVPLWGMQLGWTLPELASAQLLGRPIDVEKFNAMMVKYNMDVDEEVYMGDSVMGLNGMLNHVNMTNVGNALNGTWANASPAQILADINSLLQSVYAATGFTIMPNRLLITPIEYGLLRSTLISSAGNSSVLKFVLDNNGAQGLTIGDFEILPSKWLLGTNNNGRGPTATNSMYAYLKSPDHIRIPLVPLQRTPMEYRSLHQLVTYYGRIGSVELIYPECVGRRSNLA